jgi:hypothetical protein
LTDGEYVVKTKGAALSYDEGCGVGSKLFELSPGEESSFTLAFDMKAISDFDYEAKKKKAKD